MSQLTDRRTVLKTIGAGAAAGTTLSGTATAHGGDHRVPSWLLTKVYEMAEKPPYGEDPTAHESQFPIYTIAPAAHDKTCAQVEDFDLSGFDKLDAFADGAWNSVSFDHTLHDKFGDVGYEFSVIWHAHFVFDDDAGPPYVPTDMVNSAAIDLNGNGDATDMVTVSPFPGFEMTVDESNVPLINSGRWIWQAADPTVAPGKEVEVVSVPFAFNCPARPAQGDHLNYCG